MLSIRGDEIVTTVGHDNEEDTKVDGFQVKFIKCQLYRVGAENSKP